MCTSKLLYMFDVALTRILFSGIFFLSDIELYLPPVVWERELPRGTDIAGVGEVLYLPPVVWERERPRGTDIVGDGEQLYLPPVVWEREFQREQILRGLGKCCTCLLLSGRESSPGYRYCRGWGSVVLTSCCLGERAPRGTDIAGVGELWYLPPVVREKELPRGTDIAGGGEEL